MALAPLPAALFAADFDGAPALGVRPAEATTRGGIDARVLQRIQEQSTKILPRDPQFETIQKRYHDVQEMVREAVFTVRVRRKTIESLAAENRAGKEGPYLDSVSTGSGFIVDAESGLAVTNAHVVSAAGRNGRVYEVEKVPGKNGAPPAVKLRTLHVARSLVTIVLHDDYILSAEVLDFDPVEDIALIKLKQKVTGEPFKAVPLGETGRIRVGDFVVAAGAPRGMSNTYTFGHISNVDRILGRIKYLQTDAALNPGNSGGPLFNMDGQAIGINAAIISNTGSNDGLGLAVMIDKVRAKIREYADTGRIHSPTVAMQVSDAPNGHGVLVQGVWPDGPAARAGVLKDDRILEVDGAPLTSGEQGMTSADMLISWIGSKAQNAPVRLTIERDGGAESVLPVRTVLTLFPE